MQHVIDKSGEVHLSLSTDLANVLCGLEPLPRRKHFISISDVFEIRRVETKPEFCTFCTAMVDRLHSVWIRRPSGERKIGGSVLKRWR